ncbi:cytochrome P450 [Boeremia exigua]|uniref:cytochrome P450 n=1 Tax=Boeremia exigua TaxID=749465 RepID=UPI001E8CB221|nr:cytochrome P450 [Boeremia exigua]KAH6629288.1 cytochrome P450 [Boeremia exigua]
MEHSAAPAARSSLYTLLAQHNAFVHVCIAVAVICVCTRLISGHRFSKIKNGRSSGIAPPTLPHWLPGLRHALNMAYSVSSFLARELEKYGDGTPFLIDAAGEKVLVVLSPKHVKRALGSPELDSNTVIHKRIMPHLMGSPQAAVDYYTSPDQNIDDLTFLQIRTRTTGPGLVIMNEKLLEILDRDISNIASGGDWVEIEDFYTFFRDEATTAIGESLLGSAIFESHPRLAQDLWTFIEGTDLLLLGLPRWLVPASHGARERLLEHLKTWGRKSDALREKNEVDGTSWHPTAGSALMQEREQMYAPLPGHGEDARASQSLALLYGGTSLAIPVMFWSLYEVLRDQTLHKKVMDELHQYTSGTSSAADITQLATSPFMQSLHSEATRFYARNASVREVVAPLFHLDDRFVVEKGTQVIIVNAPIARFTSEWAQARPQAVKEPLTSFWAERFLIPEGTGVRYSETGLSGNWTSFGGGEHRCPGRFFARDMAFVTLVLFLQKYEVELVDPEGARRFDPVWNEIAFGTMVPKGKIAARLRRRKV